MSMELESTVCEVTRFSDIRETFENQNSEKVGLLFCLLLYLLWEKAFIFKKKNKMKENKESRQERRSVDGGGKSFD